MMTCIFGLNTWRYKKTQTHLLYGSGHGGHGSSLSAGAAHTCQVLGDWNRHLGASLLQNICKDQHKHKWRLSLMRQVQIKVLDWRCSTQHSTSGNNLPWRIDAPRCPVSPVWDEIWPHWQNSAGTVLHLLPPGSHSHDTGPRPPDVQGQKVRWGRWVPGSENLSKVLRLKG